MQKKIKTCNQCHQQMHGAGDMRYFCPRPDCPNFALLQIPREDLEEKN